MQIACRCSWCARHLTSIRKVRAWPSSARCRESPPCPLPARSREAEHRLSYFRQLAFILGAVSLIVGFLLVTTIVTVSVNERIGEIAVMRAIGVSRVHIVQQIVIEGIALSLDGAGRRPGARHLHGAVPQLDSARVPRAA